MKLTIGQAITPEFRHYLGLGAATLLLQALMKTAAGYRQQGRWGKSGPTEVLNDHYGCVNSDGAWHTARRSLKTHREHVDRICDCILSALCTADAATVEWRKEHSVALDREFVFRSKDDAHGRDPERDAFERFVGLHGHRLPFSLNTQYSDVKVLCFPQLIISATGIILSVEATSASELRVSKGCASRWGVAWLLKTQSPQFAPNRETFTQFLSRATEFYKNAVPPGRLAEAA